MSGRRKGCKITLNTYAQLASESKYSFNGENKYFYYLSGRENIRNTYLLFLLVEIIYNDTNKQVQGEEGPKDDENNKVKIHV